MKKELMAGMFLVAILIGCIINISYLSSLTDELIFIVEETVKQASDENWDSAAEKSENAMKLWEKNTIYLSIVLPNETIDSVTKALNELQKEIKAEDNDSASLAAQAAITQLENTASMEQVNIESVF